MKVVYAITGGGSTLDILGVFEDRSLADACLVDWRASMGVYDDGWDIEELTIWDRLPTHWTLWKMHASDYRGDFKVTTDKEEIYEWGTQKPRETIANDYSLSYFNLMVQGADHADVQQKMQAELTKRGLWNSSLIPVQQK